MTINQFEGYDIGSVLTLMCMGCNLLLILAFLLLTPLGVAMYIAGWVWDSLKDSE